MDVTRNVLMTTTHYIAEIDEARLISAVWVKPVGRKSVRLFNPSVDQIDAGESARFDGATEADIKKWIAVQKALTAR